MFDFYDIGLHFKEPLMMAGYFAGNGASVPLPVANVKDSQPSKTSITRNSTGNLVVTLLDVPIGILQNYDFWVSSSSAAGKNVAVTPPVAATPYTFQLNVTYAVNSAAVDVAVGELLQFMIVSSRSQVP